MRFDLSRFKSGVDRIDRTYEPAQFGTADAADFQIIGPVTLTADVVKDGSKVQIRGRLRATLELPCSRCLDGYRVPVDAAIDLTYLPETPAAEGDRSDRREPDEESDGVQADDFGVSFYAGDAIDLGQMMREQFFLALPMKPLCQPDCKGLCPMCGVNRNRETCSCASTWVDPRLEALKQFKKN